ncbi:N-acetyltransferase [Vibrio sp. SM6]|uniref:N-acetyltransferase n=1 Tax=Vibrio agarilyticus TaxID=2726741 RepID=A0A7X8YG90_9VIBR|nr:N-acetyltransferase [Vibrio agarilyticus]NLS12713.1 N-acetyltransferase [Vibrio agarilyticus]
MLIRTEAPADLRVIERLLRSVDNATQTTGSRADTVARLRENGLATLSLVACRDDGVLVGHALFSPILINGEESYWQGLAQLTVNLAMECDSLDLFDEQPEATHQHEKAEPQFCTQVAQDLAQQGIEMLAELGYPVCVAQGEDALLTSLGMVPASTANVNVTWQHGFEPVYLLPLQTSGFDAVHGELAFQQDTF